MSDGRKTAVCSFRPSLIFQPFFPYATSKGKSQSQQNAFGRI